MPYKIEAHRRLSAWIIALLTFLISIYIARPAFAQEYPPASPAPDSSEGSAEGNPPARVARISYLKGKVSFLPAGQSQWSEATLNFIVTTGDRIYTDKGARAELEVGPYTVHLSESTDLLVTNLNDQVMQLGLEQGTLRLSVYQLLSGDTVEVDTPNGPINAIAPGKYRADVYPDGNRTVVRAISGAMEVTGPGISQRVEPNQAFGLIGEDPIEVAPVPTPERDDFDKWCDDRDRHLEKSTSAIYVSTATPGYDDLDVYGHWTLVDEYGPIWYPPVAVGWVPYRMGHWAWIDPWGWTWVEDEPWGFCPFHFGRWVLVAGVWGWLPGPIVAAPVFAPAMVAFLGGAGFSISVGVGLVGWFPLGPGEPFLPWYHHDVAYLRAVNITNIRNVTNITNIVNITNVNNIHYAYRTVAATVVPHTILSSGQPVFRNVVRVPPEQIARAQILPHPPVNPTLNAARPGRLVPPPPVRPVPFTARAAHGPIPPAVAAGHAPIPPGARPVTPVPNAGRTVPVEPGVRTAPRVAGVPPVTAPRLITRTAPPPPVVPFVDRRQAMVEHPGRPLEPVQIANLRAGRPAGPIVDKEFPPHVVPVVRERIPPPRLPPPRLPAPKPR